MFSRIYLLAVILATIFITTQGEILCYSCVSQGNSDPNCISNPAAVTTSTPIVKCKYKYCTIRRLETNDGEIYSFLRGCEDDPLPNGQNPGEDITVWAQSCNFADLCNIGDGLNEIVPGGSSGGGNSGDIIVVPGKSYSSSDSLRAPTGIFFLVVLFGFFQVIY